MKRKSENPGKVEEPASPLLKAPAAKASARQDGGGVRYAEDAEVRRVTAKILKEHEELFRRLAQ